MRLAGTTDNCGRVFTVVVAVAVLFVVLGSNERVIAAAVFVSEPAALGTTPMVTVATALLARLPSEQVTTPAIFVQVPWLAVAEAKVTPAGNASVTVTLAARPGPLFVTEMVYVSGAPTMAGFGEADLARARLAAVPTQHASSETPIESRYHPALLVVLSVPLRQRNWTFWPAAAAGRLTTVAMNPPELPLHACRPPRGFPRVVLSVLL